MRAAVAAAVLAGLLLAGCGAGEADAAGGEGDADVPTVTLAEAHAEITQYDGYERLTEQEVDGLTDEWCKILREGGRSSAEAVISGLASEHGNDEVALGEAVLVVGTMTQYGCPELGDAMSSD